MDTTTDHHLDAIVIYAFFLLRQFLCDETETATPSNNVFFFHNRVPCLTSHQAQLIQQIAHVRFVNSFYDGAEKTLQFKRV